LLYFYFTAWHYAEYGIAMVMLFVHLSVCLTVCNIEVCEHIDWVTLKLITCIICLGSWLCRAPSLAI